ncbi:hypothetical protein WA158_006472 [Blastocystis sp. Blastoise]
MAVPQSIVLKQKRIAALKAYNQKASEKAATALVAKRETITKRAEKYANEYKQMERDLINKRREARKLGGYFIEPEGKLAIVCRIRGVNQTHPKVRKILQLFRLRQIHNACFVKLNKATIEMLRIVEPYIMYGYPNLKTVKALIYKRGYAKVNGQRIPLSSNDVIEQVLGKFGITCIEDLIHEIYTVGPHFKQANNFIWTFKLNSPSGGYTHKLRHFNENGEYGNREYLIGGIINRMI